jgi:bifunctional non-homologous end joining protein LigD
LPSAFVEPCVPTASARPPSGTRWVHEIKHDGYRLIVRRDGERVRLFTRHGYDWTAKYPRIVEALAALRAETITLDGEAVYCGDNGVSDFAKLHSQVNNDAVIMYAFDLLELNGRDLRNEPLEVRKATLQSLLRKGKPGVHYNEHLSGDGKTIFNHVCKLGLEGIVSKRRDLPYRSGRSKIWIKVKNPASAAVLRIADGTW